VGGRRGAVDQPVTEVECARRRPSGIVEHLVDRLPPFRRTARGVPQCTFDGLIEVRRARDHVGRTLEQLRFVGIHSRRNQQPGHVEYDERPLQRTELEPNRAVVGHHHIRREQVIG
jgi:hypothetical protein